MKNSKQIHLTVFQLVFEINAVFAAIPLRLVLQSR